MENRIVCPCGRVLEKRNRAPDFSRRGRVHCRCNAVLGHDEDGNWDALLIARRESFGALRKLAGHTALLLLRLSRSIRIPTWRWIRLGFITPLLSPNKAPHVRLEVKMTPFPSI